MALFMLHCCFNGCCKRRNIGISTPRNAKNSALCIIARSCDSTLCSIERSFKKKFLYATPRYATQCEIRAKKFFWTLRYAVYRGVATLRYVSLSGVNYIWEFLCESPRRSSYSSSRLKAKQQGKKRAYFISLEHMRTEKKKKQAF
jgi:hypothetical protein